MSLIISYPSEDCNLFHKDKMRLAPILFLRMKVIGLDHLGIAVRDLAESERFYCNLLGMTVVMRLPDQVLLRCGHQNVGLFHLPETEAVRMRLTGEELIRNPLGKAHFAFLVTNENLIRYLQYFNENGIPLHGPVDWGDHQCLYFLDPSGNLLEVVNYGERDSAAYP